MSTYTAKDLEDIAQMFDELARRAFGLSFEEGSTVAVRRFHSGADYAYKDCARILRETKLEGGS